MMMYSYISFFDHLVEKCWFPSIMSVFVYQPTLDLFLLIGDEDIVEPVHQRSEHQRSKHDGWDIDILKMLEEDRQVQSEQY